MKEIDFENKLSELVGNDISDQYNYLKKFDKQIFGSTEDGVKWIPFNPNKNHNKLESGVYLTIRCGYGGIYQCCNTWNAETQDWEIKCTDNSFVIMYKDIESYIK